jgi:hypothetical protein
MPRGARNALATAATGNDGSGPIRPRAGRDAGAGRRTAPGPEPQVEAQFRLVPES